MKVRTTYLQMFARPERIVLPPREGLTVVHANQKANLRCIRSGRVAWKSTRP